MGRGSPQPFKYTVQVVKSDSQIKLHCSSFIAGRGRGGGNIDNNTDQRCLFKSSGDSEIWSLSCREVGQEWFFFPVNGLFKYM